MSEFDEKAMLEARKHYLDPENCPKETGWTYKHAFESGARWQFDQLKAELSELQAGYYFIDSESMRKGSIINELNDEITALKEKIRGLECDFQLDANRAIEYKEKLALAVEGLQKYDPERMDHDTYLDVFDCITHPGYERPGRTDFDKRKFGKVARETLAKLGEKMEGKE